MTRKYVLYHVEFKLVSRLDSGFNGVFDLSHATYYGGSKT